MRLQLQNRHSPVIVGDHYELAEAGLLGGNQEDLLAKAELAALLPMSGYGKPQDAIVDGQLSRFDNTATFRVSVTFGLIL